MKWSDEKMDKFMSRVNCVSFGANSTAQGSSSQSDTGNFSTSSGFGGGKTSSTGISDSFSNQSMYGPQEDALKGMYSNATNLQSNLVPQYQQQGQNASQFIGGVQQGAMPAWQKMLNPNGNPYETMMKDSIMSDANRATQGMLGQTDARAVASGMSGGSRHGTAIGAGMEGINRNAQQQMANVGMQNYNQDQNRAMQAIAQSGNMANLGMAGFQPLNAQWDNLKNQAGVLGAPTVLTDSGSSSTNVSDSMNLSGQLSNNLGWGLTQGAGAGSGSGFDASVGKVN